jgi:hypothetical protein
LAVPAQSRFLSGLLSLKWFTEDHNDNGTGTIEILHDKQLDKEIDEIEVTGSHLIKVSFGDDHNDNGTGTIEIEATVNETRYTTAAQ